MYLVNTSELHMLVFDTGLSASLAYLQENRQVTVFTSCPLSKDTSCNCLTPTFISRVDGEEECCAAVLNVTSFTSVSRQC